MIDVHLHVVPPRLPGVGPLNPLLEKSVEEVACALCRDMKDAGVQLAFAMGSYSQSEEDPLGVEATLQIARAVRAAGEQLQAIGIADPMRSDAEHLQRVEQVLATGQVRALKAYLGYLHFPPDHAGYRPYYELAERFHLPFIFHTGDTWSPRARLRFAQPLLVDEVAVDHPQVRFVLAHIGNPWMMDAAEVIYKNLNVWGDLSGLAVGSAEALAEEARQETLHEVQQALAKAFRYAERPNRFLFGSDWPLVHLPWYRRFIASTIPEVYHPQIFQENAQLLFRVSL